MKDRVTNTKHILLINLYTAFTILVFAPMEFFFSNVKDFDFSINDVFLISGVFFLFSFVVLSILQYGLYFINKSCSKIFLTLQTAITTALYIQGNFLRTDYGELNGDVIEWSLYKKDSYISLSVWAVILLVLLVVCVKIDKSKLYKVLTALSLWIVMIQVFALVTSLFTTKDFWHKEKVVATTDYQFEMGTRNNYIILLLDTLDSPTFFSVYSDNPTYYSEILADFTYYKNTSGMYQYTALAVPYIFSGSKYTEEDSFDDYIEYQYSNSPFLKKLSDMNYRIGVYSPSFVIGEDTDYHVVNMSKMNVTVSSKRKMAEFLYRLVAYRYAPFHLKDYFWFYPDTDDFVEYECNNKEAFTDDNFAFFDDMEKVCLSNDDNAFFFYHLSGTHPPFNITDDFMLSDDETSIEAETRGNMVLVEAYLEKLKSMGCYDNSVIIIMGDHGYTDLRQAPVLLVKGIDEQKEFSISDIPVSYADCQDMFNALLEGMSTDDLFDEERQKKKNRVFYQYDFDKQGDVVLTEYLISEDSFVVN